MPFIKLIKILLFIYMPFYFMACGTSSSPAEEENASWTRAKRVSSEIGNNQQNASVAITTNNGGYTSLVYEEYNPLTHFYEIYHTSTIIGNVNRRTNGFGAIQKISHERRGNATLPKLALTVVEGQIQQSVVWQQYDGTYTNIWARTYRTNDGEGWGSVRDTDRGPKKIGEEEHGSLRYPIISTNNRGHFVSKWFSYVNPIGVVSSPRSTSHRLQGSKNLSSNIWDSPPWFANYSASYSLSSLQLHLNNDDEILYLWNTQNNNNDLKSLYASFHHQTSIQVSYQLYPHSSSTSAMNNNGDVAIVWIDKIDDRYYLKTKQYNNIQKDWQETETIAHHSRPIYSPQVTIDEQQNIVVSFIRKGNLPKSHYPSILYIAYNAHTNKWTEYEGNKLLTYINTKRSVKNLQMKRDKHKNIFLTWSEPSTSAPTRDRVYLKQLHPFNEQNLTTAKVRLSNNYNENAMNPQLAVNNDGYAIVVWEQFDADSSKSSLYYSAFQ